MFDAAPCHALQESDGRALRWQTERLLLQAVNGIPKLRLQTRPGAQVNPAPLETLAGIVLPAGPQEKAAAGSAVYWLAPNDWLLLEPATDAGSIGNALQQADAGAASVITDVTDAWSIIDMSGEDAAAKLAEGCSVDLDGRLFVSGSYALTRLQRLSVIIHRLDDPPRFRILTDRSTARFLWDWLRS